MTSMIAALKSQAEVIAWAATLTLDYGSDLDQLIEAAIADLRDTCHRHLAGWDPPFIFAQVQTAPKLADDWHTRHTTNYEDSHT